MTKTKSQKLRALKKRIKGKGDYDIFDDPQPQKVKNNPIVNLENRVSKLEGRISKPKSVVGKAAGLGGRMLGGLLGQGDLGEMAGTEIAKWFGHGDYSLRSNSLVASMSGSANSVPKFDGDGKRGIRVTEREYIGDLFSGQLSGGSSAFTNQSFTINPGDPMTFPWLSAIASQFEQYVPHGIIFEFVSTSSTFNGASQALGTVIMATDYDPDDQAYSTKMEMENADYSNSTKASSNAVHGIECDTSERATKALYVRSGEIGTQSKKFFDLGIFQIATIGMSTANVNLGEIWVSYDITFYKKQIHAGLYGNGILTNLMTTELPLVANPLGSSTRLESGSLRLSFTGNTITFPAHITTGRYLVVVSWSSFIAGTAIVPTSYSLTYSNCSLFNPSLWSGVNAWFTATKDGLNAIDNTAPESTLLYWILITGPSASLTFPNLAVSGDQSVAKVMVTTTQLPFHDPQLY